MNKWIFILLTCACGYAASIAQPITVGPGGDFATLEDAESSMGPGDTVVVLDGTYTDGAQFLTVSGTDQAQIVVQSETPHGAIFRGGTEAIHLVNCAYVVLDGFVFEQQTGNGVNIDDGGDYDTPTHHITVINCRFQDMAASGNNDQLKLSGLDDFLVKNCAFFNGADGGSGIDMVGCHRGVIEDNVFDELGSSGIQAKGGSQHIVIQRNIFADIDQRAVNLGGSTGLQFFRPPLPNPIVDAFEAADLEVFSNIFIRSWSPVAYVGCVRVKVYNNTIYSPENWVIRILQETTEPGFLTCADNEFRNNAVYLPGDLTEVNIGPNTDPQSFIFTNNLWYNAGSSSWAPALPVTDSNQLITDPLFTNPANEDFSIPPSSPCVEAGIKLPAPVTDFVQNFYYDPPSIGAFEGHTSTTTAPYQIADDGISMYPNPSASTVKIEGNFTNANIYILNSTGQIVQDYSNASSPLTISLDDLPNGLYFIKIASQVHQAMSVERILKAS